MWQSSKQKSKAVKAPRTAALHSSQNLTAKSVMLPVRPLVELHIAKQSFDCSAIISKRLTLLFRLLHTFFFGFAGLLFHV